MKKGRLALASAALLICAPGMIACTTMQTCYDWTSYSSPQAAFSEARLAVIGTPTPLETTAELFGVTVPLYEISVQAVLKGDPPASLTVSPAPETCPSSVARDPFAVGQPLVMLLNDAGGTWHPLTPFEGTYPADEPLPFGVDGLFDLQNVPTD